MQKSHYQQIIERSVAAQPEGQKKYFCLKCRKELKPLVSKSAILGDIKVHPSLCGPCRREQVKALDDEKAVEKWREGKGGCYGLQNFVHHHEGRTPYLDSIG